MTDASPETIQRLIENSEKGLSRIEMSLPIILEARQSVIDAIEKKEERNVTLELTLVVLDSLLAEDEVIYDISASLNALLKATDDYTRRYYMQSLNLCFWEACQLFVGDDGDGLLYRIEKQSKELYQAGCQYIARHIIDDVQKFQKDYTDKNLRDITRHYNEPIKMYESQQELTNIEFFANGASQLMVIRMEVSVVSSYLLNLIVPVKKEPLMIATSKKCDLNRRFNDALYNKFNDENLRDIVGRVLGNGQKKLDEYYRQYQNCSKAIDYFAEKNYQMSAVPEKIMSLIALRMETHFLKCDIACSVWGYLNAASDKERSQNLRLIHITKQAALTHIYGYNEKTRPKSLWAKIKAFDEVSKVTLKTDDIEESLKELTSNLTEDQKNSNIYTHYRYKQDYYIPVRLETFGKMIHYKELVDSQKLLNVCKALEDYTHRLLFFIDETQKKEREKQYNEWMTKIDELIDNAGNDEDAKDTLKSMRNPIDVIYGDKTDNDNVL